MGTFYVTLGIEALDTTAAHDVAEEMAGAHKADLIMVQRVTDPDDEVGIAMAFLPDAAIDHDDNDEIIIRTGTYHEEEQNG